MSDQPIRTTLPAGATLHKRADAGARLLCLKGQLLVHPAPRWLAGQMLTHALAVGEGESLHIDAGGWLRIEARGQAEVALLAPQPGWLRTAFEALIRGVRRLAARKRLGSGQSA